MKRFFAVTVIALGMSVCAMADDFTGTIVDKSCAGNKDMIGDEACTKRCLERGDPAVLATADGKIYAIADQDKVKAAAGKKVTITGKLTGDTIKVDSVKVM